jgi:hypothetical protein
MTTRNKLLAAGALALAALAAPVAVHAQSKGSADAAAGAELHSDSTDTVEPTSDTLLWFRTQPLSHDPFVNATGPQYKVNGVTESGRSSKPETIDKQMLHLEHTDTGGIIWNSLTITALFANGAERAAGNGGSNEAYLTYRGDIPMSTFGLPRLWVPGFILGTLLEVGGDLNWKDDGYESRRKFLLVGPIVYLDLPGSVTFAVHAAQDWNHDFITNEDTHYHPTWNTELSYTEYFDSNHTWRWEGVFNVTGPKGWDTYLSKTKTEYYTYNQIVLDWGPLVNVPQGRLDVFAGVQFWYNKFGYPAWGQGYGTLIKSTGNVALPGAGAGAVELTPYIGVSVHF